MKNLLLIILSIFFLFGSNVENLEAQLPIRNMPVAQSLNVSARVGDNARSLDLAKEFLLAHNYLQAIDETDNIITSDPYHVDAYLLRGYLRELLGMNAEAKLDFEKAKMLNPYAIPVMGYSGPGSRLNLMSFNPSFSFKELPYEVKYDYYLSYLDNDFSQKFASGDSELVEKQYTKEWNYLGKIIQFSEKKEYRRAMELTDEMLTDFPKSPLGLDMKGLLLMKTDRINEAEDYLQEAVKLDPNFSIAWYNLSVVKRKQEQPEISLEYLNRALTLQADLNKAYFDRALVKKQLGDEKGAVEDYNTLIDTNNGRYLEAFLNRGLTLKMLGDFEGALEDIDLVMANSQATAELYKYRGNILSLMGQEQSALKDYAKAIELNPSYGEAYFNRAILYLNIGSSPKACSDFAESNLLGYEPAKEKMKYFCD